MTSTTTLARRVFAGSIVQPDEGQPPPSTYKDIASANDHLHEVLNAFIKNYTGQKLTESEQRLIEQCIVSKRWQLEHTKKD